MSKYEINNGIYKTWIVNNYFQYFIKRKERVEVKEKRVMFYSQFEQYDVSKEKLIAFRN